MGTRAETVRLTMLTVVDMWGEEWLAGVQLGTGSEPSQ